jgi:nucleotide-binding universal stress UspA family protein
MHLTVGYLATPTGDDGIALASALAKTFDAAVDVLLVVREELPDGHPGRLEYQQLLISRGEEWVAKAVATLAEGGVRAAASVTVGESFAETLIQFAEQNSSDLIVVGGARDGFFGRHTIGPVSGALLHSSPIPVALAPRGYAEDPDESIVMVTAAVPTRPGDDNPLPFALTLASAAGLGIRMLSLVSAENLAEAGSAKEVRAFQVEAAEENLAVAARALPDAPEIESLVADGMTLESALKKLKWDDGELLVVGSSRFAAPRRLFLGSTAARILAGVDVPVIVVPREEREE